MKCRKGFKNIVVDGILFQYAVSLAQHKLIFYVESDPIKFVTDLVPDNNSTSWRGIHGDGGWGKREVAKLIRYKWHTYNELFLS